jgi:hypothetical protein
MAAEVQHMSQLVGKSLPQHPPLRHGRRHRDCNVSQASFVQPRPVRRDRS